MMGKAGQALGGRHQEQLRTRWKHTMPAVRAARWLMPQALRLRLHTLQPPLLPQVSILFMMILSRAVRTRLVLATEWSRVGLSEELARVHVQMEVGGPTGSGREQGGEEEEEEEAEE
mmetsp:Transcript_76827/g.194035  ORF Transcript_76827/g.194035 Transcript_76827/m.194035 type:complete len:117 (+) Transcript_76827:165-515(+)